MISRYHIFLDFYWSQQLSDDELKIILFESDTDATFLSQVKAKAALDFSNLDRTFQKRVDEAVRTAPFFKKSFTREEAFYYWSDIVQSKKNLREKFSLLILG